MSEANAGGVKSHRFMTTFATPCVVRGAGLHSGQWAEVEIHPRAEVGLWFQRVDLPGAPRVEASLFSVSGTTHATTLACGGASVATPEHLLAALWLCGVTHAEVRLNGPEVPILDGSALPWVEAIEAAGVKALEERRPRLRLTQPVWFQGGTAQVLGLPGSNPRFSAFVDFGVPHAGSQSFDWELQDSSVGGEVARARTFALEEWVPALREAGLSRGGTLENAVLIGPAGPSSPWRMPNELAAHKLLDALGDFQLLTAPTGAIFEAHVVLVKAGHGAHVGWMRQARAGFGLLEAVTPETDTP